MSNTSNLALYFAGLPAFFAYLLSSAAMLWLFMAVYSKITPHCEWKLIRQGNSSAAVAFAGATLGFVVPLYSAMSHSVSITDFFLWGVVAFLVQLVAFFVVKGVLAFKGENLSQHITDNHMAYGVFAGSVFLAVGLLNAASMVW